MKEAGSLLSTLVVARPDDRGWPCAAALCNNVQPATLCTNNPPASVSMELASNTWRPHDWSGHPVVFAPLVCLDSRGTLFRHHWQRAASSDTRSQCRTFPSLNTLNSNRSSSAATHIRCGCLGGAVQQLTSVIGVQMESYGHPWTWRRSTEQGLLRVSIPLTMPTGTASAWLQVWWQQQQQHSASGFSS